MTSALPATRPAPRAGGQIVVDQLVLHGARQVFTVPGESFLAVLDALHDAPIDLTVCRQEGGACMMAEAQGKLTGRPGICMVTRGPGATNAAAGLHIAMQDSTPLILFVGQIERSARGREAFQELDYRAVFGPMVKWADEIDDIRRIPELIARAWAVACSGRPGPVVLALPEDMLVETAPVADARPWTAPPEQAPGAAELAGLMDRVSAAQRPMLVVGGSRWSAQTSAHLARIAAHHALPVVCSFRRQTVFPADHPCHAGDLGFGPDPALLQRLRDADLVVLLGGRLSEVPSQGYTLLDIPAPQQALVHIHPDPDELGRVYQADLAIAAAPDALCAAWAQAISRDFSQPPPASPGLLARVQAAHAQALAWSDARAIRIPGRLQMGQVMQHLRSTLPGDTIVCNGAGNFALWVHRFWRFTTPGSQLAPTSGSMGYGLPAAVGAQRLWPERTVLCVAGDGDLLMHGQELATAVQYSLPIIVIVIDNGMLGTIRMHQEREYPGRVTATALHNPDFATWAQSFGAQAERVEDTASFAPALARLRHWAAQHRRPVLLHCLIDPQAISPTRTLDEVRGTRAT
ncbi:thiamine pyrophosphate-binding protein [Amphibiibacter pelophylacis]|uniref:Thiamine pyrophosphate-binding protein n=1 Tax=Amphibiibacter pelophylacis TaxID=1799477 RepID=A0ACC6P3N1_9BURK